MIAFLAKVSRRNLWGTQAVYGVHGIISKTPSQICARFCVFLMAYVTQYFIVLWLVCEWCDNGWMFQVTFADHSRFSTVLNVAHVSRASGHRFRTSSMACHPVLPLLLTTSHHNSPSASLTQSHVDDVTEFNVHGRRSPRVSAYTEPAIVGSGVSASGCQLSPDSAIMAAMPFCSELILWRVSPVGPLSKSGGLTELARINSPAVSAFTSVAWLPTLLPRSVLVVSIILMVFLVYLIHACMWWQGARWEKIFILFFSF